MKNVDLVAMRKKHYAFDQGRKRHRTDVLLNIIGPQTYIKLNQPEHLQTESGDIVSDLTPIAGPSCQDQVFRANIRENSGLTSPVQHFAGCAQRQDSLPWRRAPSRHPCAEHAA